MMKNQNNTNKIGHASLVIIRRMANVILQLRRLSMKRLLIGLLFTISMGSLAMEGLFDGKPLEEDYESDGILDPFAQELYKNLRHAVKSTMYGKEWYLLRNQNHHKGEPATMKEFLCLLVFKNINEKCKVRNMFGFTDKYGTFCTELRSKDDSECLNALKNMYELLKFPEMRKYLNCKGSKILCKNDVLENKLQNPQESFEPHMSFDTYKIIDEEESK